MSSAKRYYALAAASALLSHLEDNLNISFAPKALRVYYCGPDEAAIIGTLLYREQSGASFASTSARSAQNN